MPRPKAKQEVKEEKQEEMKEVKDVKKPKALVYCGPTIKNVAQQYTSFEAVPIELLNMAKECEAITKLLVEPAKLMKVRQALKVNTSPESIMFNKIVKYLGGLN